MKNYIKAISILLFILLFNVSSYAFANNEIRTKIEIFENGISDKNIDLTMSVFDKNAIWNKTHTYYWVKDSIVEIFGYYDDIHLERKNIILSQKDGYDISTTEYLLRAKIKKSGSLVEQSITFIFLWKNSGNGLKIIAMNHPNLLNDYSQISEPQTGSPANTPNNKKLVAYYPFNGDTQDHSGNGNHGVNHGATFVSGVSGKALSFDGKNNWVKVGSSKSLDTKNKITLEAWIKPKNDGAFHPILEYNDGTNFGVHIWQWKSWSDLFVNFFDNRGKYLTAKRAITAGWQHIAAVYDGTYGKLYRNGELVASNEFGALAMKTSYDFYIGRRPSQSNNYFNGLIDEVKIYNYALTANEIKSDYNKTKFHISLPDVSSSKTQYGEINPNGEITITTFHTSPKGVNNIAYTSIVVKDENNKVYIQDPYKTNNNPASKRKKPIPSNHFGVYPTEKMGYTVRDLIDAGMNGAVKSVSTRYSKILSGSNAKVIRNKLKVTLHLKLNNLPAGKKYIYARTVDLQSVDSGWKKVGEFTIIENTASPMANSGTQSNKPVLTTTQTLRCPSSRQQAYRLYTNNYNELQKLMQQGHGDIPEAQVFYKKYKFYKDCYEAPATQLKHDSDGAVSAAADLTATTPILSQTVYASADAYVYAYNYRNWNRSNRGRYDQLVAGWHPTGGESRAYIKFDLFGTDASKVNKAILKLYHFQTSGNNGVELGIYRVTSPWNEDSDTYHSGCKEKTASPGDISWVQQPKIDSAPIATFNPGTGMRDWTKINITSLVKQWLSGTPNYGLVVKPIGHLGRNISVSAYHFASRERKANLDNPKGKSKAPMLILFENSSVGNTITQSTQQHHATKPTKSKFSCANQDNEERGCCCFNGAHTYRFNSQYVINVLARFDTGRKLNCLSTVNFDVDRGNGWETVKTVQAKSSKGGSEIAPTDVLVPVNGVIKGFRISDGCACCIDSSEIMLNADYPGSGFKVNGSANHISSGTYRVEQGQWKSTWKLKIEKSKISGISEWICCPGHRIDPIKGTIYGNSVVIERDCSGQGFNGSCRQIYKGKIKGNRIVGICSGTGLHPGDTWTLFLNGE